MELHNHHERLGQGDKKPRLHEHNRRPGLGLRDLDDQLELHGHGGHGKLRLQGWGERLKLCGHNERSGLVGRDERLELRLFGWELRLAEQGGRLELEGHAERELHDLDDQLRERDKQLELRLAERAE